MIMTDALTPSQLEYLGVPHEVDGQVTYKKEGTLGNSPLYKDSQVGEIYNLFYKNFILKDSLFSYKVQPIENPEAPKPNVGLIRDQTHASKVSTTNGTKRVATISYADMLKYIIDFSYLSESTKMIWTRTFGDSLSLMVEVHSDGRTADATYTNFVHKPFLWIKMTR